MGIQSYLAHPDDTISLPKTTATIKVDLEGYYRTSKHRTIETGGFVEPVEIDP